MMSDDEVERELGDRSIGVWSEGAGRANVIV